MIVKVLLVATPLLLGLQSAHALSPPREQCLTLEQGWVRAPVAGRDMTAAYGQLHNRCSRSASVSSMESPQAAAVELHRSEVVDGVSRMRPAPDVVIEPGTHVVLEPGGLHLMLHGLVPGVQAGSELELRLGDSRGGKDYQFLPVRAR